MKLDEATAARYGLGGHQQHYFNVFLDVYELAGMDVLEVGGAMPRELVVDRLGARSWTCIQSADYAQHRNDNQTPSGSEADGRYTVLYANVEDLLAQPEYHNRFDAVFSIACFEHIHQLPRALAGMHAALRPRGRLFTMFAPIWSGPWGQHFSDPVPERFAYLAPPGGWQTIDIFETPWDHLLLSRPQFFERYRSRFDAAFAEELTYQTFNSPQINRYFFEDYLAFFALANFRSLHVQGTSPLPRPDLVAEALAKVRERYTPFGYHDFLHAGLFAFLEK